MPRAKTWEDVQAKFDALSDAGVYPPFDVALEPIETLIASRQYTPDAVYHFIEKIREMNDDLGIELKKSGDEAKKKRSVREAVQKTEADFDQSNWTVESVTNNSAQQIYQFIFGPIKKAVEEPKPIIKIPVVLPVMTAKEAKELDGANFNDVLPSNYVDDLKSFKALLKPGWRNSYGATTDRWKPFDSIDKTINELMSQVLTKVQQTKGYPKPLEPFFIGVHQLKKTQRSLLNYLRLNGCFVINDVVSMWHPDIQRAYRSTLLDAFPNTIVFRIAPLNPVNQAPLLSAQPLIALLDKFQDLEFFQRMTSDYDLKCAEMSASYDLGRFVMNFTPDLIAPYDKVNSPLTGQIIGEQPR